MSRRLLGTTAVSAAVILFPVLASGQYWDTETVDGATANVGQWSSIALDGDGNPHISYYDSSHGYLKYARCDGAAWHLEDVDTTGNAGLYTSLALDGDNNPHISYYYDSTAIDHKYLYYARNDGAWHTLQVAIGGGGGDTGRYTSLALDGNNNPHISYYDYNHGRVLYAYYDGSWHLGITVEIVGLAGAAPGTSLALDSGDLPHVSYYDYTNRRLRYARYDGAAWHHETVDETSAVVGQYSSLALDGDDNPHISYYDGTNHRLKYARRDGAAWHRDDVDATGNAGLYTSLALDSAGNPRISYYDSNNDCLKYARYDGGWQHEVADTVHDVGRFSSLALDRNDDPHISYYDTTSGNLKYARWVPPTSAAPTPRYLELSVAGGPDFAAGQTLTLNWEVHPDSYGYAGSPRNVYLGVILSPEGALENAAPSVPEVLGTAGTLMLFHPAADGPHACPPTEPAWRDVRFPLPSGNSGSLDFTVPANVGRRCVFAAAFSPFPVPDGCVTSNGFNLPPLAGPPTPAAPSGRSGAFHLPAGYTRQALPLLVAFHGTGGDGAGMVAAFRDLADEYGFIVVAPDSGDPAVWWISEAGSESDDYPLIMAWVDWIRSYPGVTIDDDHVMALGFSGGAPVAPYIATNDGQFTAFAAMHGEVWEPSIGPALARAWLSTGADDWWTPAMFDDYADMFDGKGFAVTLNVYPGGHTISGDERRAAVDWWLR